MFCHASSFMAGHRPPPLPYDVISGRPLDYSFFKINLHMYQNKFSIPSKYTGVVGLLLPYCYITLQLKWDKQWYDLQCISYADRDVAFVPLSTPQ